MKKILFIAMACVLCLGLVGGAFAAFSDTETATNNTFTAGTLDLKINGYDDPSGLMAVGPMAPGVESGQQVLTFSNVGNLDGSLSFTLTIAGEADGDTTSPDGTGSDMTDAQVAAVVYVTEALYTPAGGSETDVLALWKAYAAGGDGNLSLQDMVDVGTWTMTETLTAGGTATIKIKVTMDSTAGNDYQGDGVNISFTGTLDQ